MSSSAAYGGEGLGGHGWEGTDGYGAHPQADGAAPVCCSLAGEDREQDPPCRLCFKHYGFLDTDNVPRDSLEFALLFEQVSGTPGWPCHGGHAMVAVPAHPTLWQAHEMVLRGYVPTSEETLQTLAALRLQSLNSDFSTHAPFPRLEELFPPHVLHARLPPLPHRPPAKCRGARLRAGLLAGGLWGQALAKQRAERDQRLRGRLREEGASTMAAIVEKWKLLQGMGRPEAMAAYVALVREWPGFGSTLFDVDLQAVRPRLGVVQGVALAVGNADSPLLCRAQWVPGPSACGWASGPRLSRSTSQESPNPWTASATAASPPLVPLTAAPSASPWRIETCSLRPPR